MFKGPNRDDWSIVSDAEAGKRGRQSPTEGSSASEQELRSMQSTAEGSHDDDDDSERWRQALSGSESAAAREQEAAEVERRRHGSFAACSRVCRGPTPVAVLCLLLVLAGYSLEQGDVGFSGVLKNTISFTQLTKAHAKHKTQLLIAKATGKHHCRPKPDPLLPRNKRPAVHIGGRNLTLSLSPPVPDPGRVLVPARKDGLLSVMTPVWPDNATLALFHNQLRSANKFLRMGTIHEWLLITPRSQVDRLTEFVEEALQLLPCVLASKMRVVADEACVPELEDEQLAKIAARTVTGSILPGWMKQQLVKMACSAAVSTPYYLITDADTFFLADLQDLDLMQQKPCTADSAVCDMKLQLQFRARNEMQQAIRDSEQVGWLTASAQTLQMPIVKTFQARSMGVTPQIMSTAVVNMMARHIEHSVTGGAESWRSYLLDRAYKAQHHKSNIMDIHGWTEYDLYYAFARNQSLWVKYHTHSRLQKTEANLWNLAELEEWDPCDNSGLKHSGFWAVVQSTTQLTGADIWKRLAPCMRLDPEGGPVAEAPSGSPDGGEGGRHIGPDSHT